jgi:3-oxoacyl-[acyl-carrier protein] reductase
MFSLAGRTALVTGATGGIGGAIAKVLAEAGARVVVSGTRRERLDEVVAEIGGDCTALPCDLADAEAVEELVPAAEEAVGDLDILVNNAGLTRDMLMMRMRDEDWADVLNVNLTSAFRLSRAAARGMMRRRYGRIISISSVVAVTGNPGQANYSASKAAMIAMNKSLAHELATRGVTANCVAPGMIETAMIAKLTEQQRAAIAARIPAGRLGTPEEIAAAVLFLASSEAAYVTGQTIHVNGGLAMI